MSDYMGDEATAYHEAGHAVVGALRGRAPEFVTIVPEGSVAGRNEFPKDWSPQFRNYFGDSPEKRHYIETRILTAVAVTIAHDLLLPDRPRDAGDAYDERWARDIIELSAGWAEADRDGYLGRLQEAARSLLEANWLWVEAVARALIERKTIFTAEVIALRPRE